MQRVTKQIEYNRSVRTSPIKYIVVHDTGNPSAGATARAHFNYFNGGNRGSSADIFVDSMSAWVVNDYHKYYSWHCGDGRGKYGITNANSVGVEMCINHDGSYAQAFENTAEVVRSLMDELNIPAERVVRHYDASRKNCPASMSDNGWAVWKDFKSMLINKGGLTVTQYEELKGLITDLTETLKQLGAEVGAATHPMIYNYIDKNMPDWARPTIQKLVDKGYLKGDGEGLNLDDNLLRMLVINDRAGVYGE